MPELPTGYQADPAAPTIEQLDELDARFDAHPMNQDQGVRIARVREQFRQLGRVLIGDVRPGRERSLVLTKLEEAAMWAVKGISREQPS